MPLGQALMTPLQQKAEPRMFTIMHTLLYPGVLGSLMYAAPDNIASGRTPLDLTQVAVACALFLMFIMDYSHSVEKGNEESYSNGTFIADLVIVVLLFIAGQRILGTPVPPDIHPAWLLVGVKVAAVCWEFLKRRDSHQSAVRSVEVLTDLLFLVLYALVGFFAPDSEKYASFFLIAVLVGDAVSYIVYRKLVPRKADRD